MSDKKIKRNSIAVSVYIYESIICQMIGGMINIPYISVLLMMGILIFILINNKKINLTSVKSVMPVFFIIVCVLVISMMLNGIQNVGEYGVYFITFGITALILGVIQCDYYLIIVYSLRISVVYIIMYFTVLRYDLLNSNNYWSLQMGAAYAFLIPAVISLIVIMHRGAFNFLKRQIITAVIIFTMSSYIIMIDCGTRGAILALGIACVMIIISKLTSIKKIIFTIIVAIIAIYAIQNIELLIKTLYDVLSIVGIRISALTKMVMWMNVGTSLDNGRVSRYEFAQLLFMKQAVFGYGVGYYEKIGDGGYVHNIIWQLLCEVGLVGTSLLLFYAVRDIFACFFSRKSKNKEDIFRSILFLITIPLLMFSSVHWMLPSFWLYLWSLFTRNKHKIMKRTFKI